MDKLEIDLKKCFPNIIDAFSFVLGEEYRSIISSRLNNSSIIQYYDANDLSTYVNYLKECKSRELSVRFLREIGIDVNINEDYTGYFYDNINSILECLIGVGKYDYLVADPCLRIPIKSFKIDVNDDGSEKRKIIILENKLKVVNYLLRNGNKIITKENFESFTETFEFSNLLNIIDKYNMIYDKLLTEYNTWINTELSQYIEYIESEEKRKMRIFKKYTNKLFREIFDRLPLCVKEAISTKSFEEQVKIIFGYMDMINLYNIEYFSKRSFLPKLTNDLNFIDTIDNDQAILDDLGDWFYYVFPKQLDYFKKIGFDFSFKKNLNSNCNLEEEFNNYLSFLNKNDLKKYIPSFELIDDISFMRKRMYESAINEYFCSRKDLVDSIKIRTDGGKKFSYEEVKNKGVFVTKFVMSIKKFIPMMYFTIRKGENGHFAWLFIHECGHICTLTKLGCGFDDLCDLTKVNPYNNRYRKYERFNETLNDIFAMEAIEFLHKRGIYLLEPRVFTKLDNRNANTWFITKELLQPLLKKFRAQVIKAYVSSNPKKLTYYIGENNYECLVDAVNEVDYLISNGVIPINASPNNPIVPEYSDLLEKFNQIYINIDDYYDTKFKKRSIIRKRKK